MTSSQLTSLNTNLVPSPTPTFTLLSSDIDHINKFVLFFYKIKNNYDRYQQRLSVCPVNINWDISTSNASSSPNIQKFSSNENIPGVLSALYYKYVLQQYYQKTDDTLFSSFIFKALEEDSLRKKIARNYFKELNCCDNTNIISNYDQYHFTQKQRYMGNR